ncbi:hypothetical protein M409DRAFT_56636 [Zasmidium cellare ATCC 36951]|uniref:Uncharacterized protein n=1 Tax=Zasmidium cellare ATCC 36951 TaxID=1080233 RepID=A0A6A6CC46_ZASCE|nr:uncharacterized protein M409DRAFT_56636 [Zasmidium cellare ATCC 36951]KAF2164363.1 hypothetical protein M409DRAFT_56636 [Zasmidium cellare ATCC 36951]
MKQPKESNGNVRDAQRRTHKLTFLDLPGEIRNHIYELYSENDEKRLKSPPQWDVLKLVEYQPRPKRGRRSKQKQKQKQQDQELRTNTLRLERLLLFTLSIIRVNRQIRREYASLTFCQAPMVVDINSEPHVWGAFVNTIGEDVLKEKDGLETTISPGEKPFNDSSEVDISVSLHRLANPVTWNCPDHSSS